MLRLGLFILFLLAWGSLTAQTTEPESLQPHANLELGAHGPGLGVVLPLHSFTWHNTVGMGMGISVRDDEATLNLSVSEAVLFYKSEVRWMYNRAKRQQQGKDLANNAGNYLGAQVKYFGGRNSNREVNRTLLTEGHWGLQRNLGGHFVFYSHVGLGWFQDLDTNENLVLPTVGAAFVYQLF